MDPVSYQDDASMEKSDDGEHTIPEDDLTITVPPQDYTDTVQNNKEQVDK